MPTVREYEAVLQRNPADTEAFVALRKAFRQAQQHDRLITLYEKRAQAITDGAKAAELYYLAAELRFNQLGDAAGAEADLANAIHRDSGHIKAAGRLKDIYREQGRTADYMTMLELEAAGVARTHDPARIAELQNEMGQLFTNHFTKLERSVRAAQRPQKLGPEHVKSIESARKIYRALGDYRSVVRLYELELDGTAEPKRRADLLLGLGRVLAEKLEELDAAAQRLTEVIRLRPRDEKALELLASVFANPNWIGADGATRAATLYFQIARRRQEAGDIENAISSLRKALTVVPGHPEASDLIERIYYDAQRFQDLDHYYRERVQGATSAEEQLDFLYKRAQLAEGDLGDPAEAQQIYAEIAEREGPAGPAGERLAELFLASREYARLAELREKQLGIVEDPQERVRLMADLAALYRDRLGDRDQSAVYLHAILQLDPGNPEALDAYADHFREKNDWPALADLLEFALEQARATGASPAELIRRLEEIAVVSEKHLGDAERALAAWQRIEELDPDHPRARDVQKRILLKSKNFERMIPILEREAARASEPAQRIEILRRVAQIHREKLGAANRAVQIYKEILQISPQDQVALRALVEIHEHEGDFAGLAQTLRDQVEVTSSKQERVSLLRRLLTIYDERLGDLMQGAWAANEILKLVPGDKDALLRLEGLLERAGDHAGLVQTLEYHAEHAGSPDERVRLVSRAAEMLENTLGDAAGAAERWEEVVALDPDDARALGALAAIYARLDRYEDLARILDAQIERLVADPPQQAEHQRRLAELCEGPLGDVRRAEQSWRALLETLPSDVQALESLARIYTANEDWPTLARILERQIPYAADPERAVELALRRAALLDEKLDSPKEAAYMLEQVIGELDPRSWDAHERLRDLYERDGDWPKVVKIAERQLFLTEAAPDRMARAMEVGTIWRDRLRDEHKAITAFERALEIDARSVEAMQALAPLYQSVRDWEHLIALSERLLEETESPEDRHRLHLEIAVILEQHLQDPKGAFDWYRRAYAEQPDAESLRLLDSVAEKHGLFEDLIAVYDGIRARTDDAAEHLASALKIASICETRLGDPLRAFNVLRDALPADPAGRELLTILERLASETGEWNGILDVYARIARARTELSERVALLRLRAEVREKRLGDPPGALDELLRSFAADPNNATTQEEILRLAGVTGRWEDALKVQAQLFALAEDLPRKVAVARKAAALVEAEVKDLVRAFRAYLNAFRLDPDDTEIVGHLWRLAGLIGRYEAPPEVTQAGKQALEAVGGAEAAASARGETAEPEAPGDEAASDDEETATPAEVGVVSDAVTDELSAEAADARAERLSARDADGTGEPTPAEDRSGAQTGVDEDAPTPAPMEGETSVMAGAEASAGAVGDADEDDEDAVTPRPAGQPARFAETETSVDMGAEATPAAEDEDDGAPVGEGDADGEVEVDDAAVIAEAVDPESSGVLEELDVDDIDVAVDASTPPPRPPVAAAAPPALPPPQGRRTPFAQPFETPWEELAQAYANLPSPDNATRRRFLIRAAEVWERGQKDVARAIADLERAFRLDPSDAAVRAELERIARDYDRWDDVCEIYLGAVDEFAPAEQTVALHHEVARFREALGQVDRAEERYRAILALRPDDPGALNRLEELARERGRWDELGAILERRTSSSVDLVTDEEVDPSRRARQRELADIYERRLEKPYEAIDTLERVMSEAGDDVNFAEPGLREELSGVCESLARLYGRVGLWTKVVDALQREADLTPDTGRARTLRLRVADVLERELGQADRAVEAFEAVLSSTPEDDEALVALDRLYESLGRWDELQETLERRSALATGAMRLDIVRRRARLLEERLNNPDAAAAALRALGPDVLADDELASALIRNLRRAGLAHEAARVLEKRVDNARVDDAPAAQVVPLLLELSTVRAEDLGDLDAAREAVNEALGVAPENPETLAALARLDLKSNDFVAYASTRRREARAQTDAARAAESLVDAGRVYRDQANSPEEARACFEEALERDPSCFEALRSLAAMHSAQGEWALARERLTTQLELADGAEMRASILTELARAVLEETGQVPEAQRFLDEALALAPDHLPAVLTAADIFFREGQWSAAETRLAEALRRVRENPQQAARLHMRLSEVLEKQGRLDEAYRQLQDAERVIPGQLPVKLALGENRYRAGKWREAAAALAPLADHPDAALHAAEVADGLAHAAQAEVKLRRPERALALYESALVLDATHVPSLRALSDLALERGEKGTARSYLERLMEGSPDPDTRTAALEQLGDLYLEAGESARARTSYETAARHFRSGTGAEVSVLQKLLELQRQDGDGEAAAHTANLLIELVQDPKERAQRRREAAALVAKQGGGEEALELLEAAFADSPNDDAVLASLCDLMVQLGRQKQMAKRLADTLPTLPPPGDDPTARQIRAGLWERFAESKRKKDPEEAIAALERALELDPDRISTRVALAALYGQHVQFADVALTNLRRIVNTEPGRIESLQALASTFETRGQLTAARCVYEVLDLLGDPEDAVKDFLRDHPVPALKAEDPYASILEEADRTALAGREAMVMAEVFTLLWEGAPHLLNERLEDLGVTAEDRVSPISDLDLARVYGQVAKTLGNKKTVFYVKRNATMQQPEIVVQTPPALVVGSEMLSAPLGQVRFELARGLELTRPEYILAAGVRPKQFTQLFGMVLRAFHPRHTKRRSSGPDDAMEQATAFRKSVPYKVSKRLVELFNEMGSVSWSSVGWRKVVSDVGNRTGLLLSGDLRAAITSVLRGSRVLDDASPSELRELIGSHEPLAELIRFALSDDYFRLREKLGTAAARAAAA